MPAAVTVPGTELGHLLVLMSSLEQIINGTKVDVAPVVIQSPPTTVTRSSPPIVSPSKLRKFLLHAEENLGVHHATAFEAPMRLKGFGPDILHLVKDEALVDIGFTEGDVIRLKLGSNDWWKSPEAKRKCTDTVTTNFSVGGSDSAKRQKNIIRYERIYVEDGGMHTFWGPPLEPGETTFTDMETKYFDEAHGDFVPIPHGFTAIMDDEEDLFTQ
jgi:hypothetical protein